MARKVVTERQYYACDQYQKSHLFAQRIRRVGGHEHTEHASEIQAGGNAGVFGFGLLADCAPRSLEGGMVTLFDNLGPAYRQPFLPRLHASFTNVHAVSVTLVLTGDRTVTPSDHTSDTEIDNYDADLL